MRLYIIGNGFDIHHGIKSQYSDFKDYVEKKDKNLFEILETYFISNELWSDFEETLAFIDMETIIDDASNYLVSYAAEDWSDSSHHDYQYEIQKAIDIVTIKLKNHFTNWILNLKIPQQAKVALNLKSKFLTFNYTSTLENVYGITIGNVLHIHNKAVSENSTLILGHSRISSEDDSFSRNNDSDTDVRVAEGNNILDKYFEDTYKNTTTIIKENVQFFSQLEEIREILVLGHSISSVDIKYFQEIKKKTKDNTTWVVSCRSSSQENEYMNKVIELGVDASLITITKLSEIKI